MKKIILITLILSLLFLPIITAKNVEVLIEHKTPQSQMIMKSFSIQSIPQSKYEIKTISEKEFEELKKDNSIIIQKNIKKRILMDASVPLIQADKAWNLQENLTNITGEGQTVCILDTGAQTNHAALVGKNATCNIDCATNLGTCTENCSAIDTNGHGTHVAGTIVSTNPTYHGVTQNTKYIPLMVCNATGSCFNQAIYDAIDWCVANKDNYNISVISMSLGGGQETSYCDSQEPSLTNKINTAVENNISVVAAAGNLDAGAGITNHSAGISSPACIQNVIRVGNTDDFDAMVNSGLRNNFFKDIVTAPGGDICSTRLIGDNGGISCGDGTFIRKSGTSMSTPHVSGIITLLNQYKKLESNTTLTPSKIKELLFNSGKIIFDADTNNNYSRVNIFNTILSSDSLSPSAQLNLPTVTLAGTGNQTFTCNATDNLQLSNLTLNIYNSTGLFYSTINQSKLKLLTINETVNLSIVDDYIWNCISYDNASNVNKTLNRTISTSSIQAQIQQLREYTNQNETSFNCSTQSTQELSNITLFIYNTTNLIHNETKNISGLNNNSVFNFTLPSETNFTYNCKSKNIKSQSAQTENYTFTYDKTAPQITLSSPTNNLKIQTKTHTFTYLENETNPDFCNLTIGTTVYSSFTQTLPDGKYTWSVSCTDKANNTNSSETFNLEIYTASSSSGGGGGSSSSQNTYTAKETELETGYTKKLRTKDKIKFISNSNNHQLTLNEIDKDKVKITIESEPITTLLYLNSPIKVDINNDGILDLEITLLDIFSRYADIQIKTISEEIPQKHIQTPEIKNQSTEQTNESIKPTDRELLRENNSLLKKILKILEAILKFFKIRI